MDEADEAAEVDEADEVDEGSSPIRSVRGMVLASRAGLRDSEAVLVACWRAVAVGRLVEGSKRAAEDWLES